MASKTCSYIKSPAKPGSDAVHCGRLVHFTIKYDDDGRAVRKYDNFCPYHKTVIALQDDDA